MNRQDEFRIFYNHTIFPALVRFERKRKRLLLWLFSTIVIILLVTAIVLLLQLPSLALLSIVPLGIYVSWLWYKTYKFKQAFKPTVIRLVLDFLDNAVNYGTLRYEANGYIGKEDFFNSHLFAAQATEYRGEDYITGKIGELDFELCELSVKDFSSVRNRLDTVFRGMFLHTTFFRQKLRDENGEIVVGEQLNGVILVLPRARKQYLTRTIRQIAAMRGKNIDLEMHNALFREAFMVFATPDTVHTRFLSEPMQEAILQYRQYSGKDIYLSVVNSDIYIAVTKDKDLLEPYIFRSNVSFELMRDFYNDLDLIMQIIEDFDGSN